MTDRQSTKRGFDHGAVLDAIEGGDPDALLGFYAEAAELRVVDAAHPDRRAFELRGKAEIVKYLRSVREGGMSRTLRGGATCGDRGLAFVEECRYQDGSSISVQTMLEVKGGLIERQTDVVERPPRRSDGG